MSVTIPNTPFGLPSDNGGKDIGIFLPMGNGGWILSSTAPPLDGSYNYNRKVALLADEIGLDFIMSMAKYRGYGGITRHWASTLDAVLLIAALAEATKRVKVWTTIHTLLQNPAVTAKMIATVDQISHGRAGLNVVTGAYKGEFDQMNAWPGLGHDERYEFADEWITAIKSLWTQESVTMNGRWVTMNDCVSEPKPSKPPFLVCAGTSTRGMKFTAEHMDAIFLSGSEVDELARSSRQAKSIAADLGRPMRTYSMLMPVMAETDAVAQRLEAHYTSGLDEEALFNMMRAYGIIDAEIGKENAFTKAARSSFMAPHIAGSPKTVADRVCELIEKTGVDGLMMIFPDYLEGMKLFAAEVLPILRQRFPSRLAVAANVG